MTLRIGKSASPRKAAFCAFGRDRRGATAVEFGLISVPFFGLFLALFQIGMYFFCSEQLQAAVQSASRNIMTGTAQTAGVTTASAFASQYLCKNSNFPSYFDCTKLIIDVRTAANFSSTDATKDFYKTTTTFCPGQPGQIVIVRVIYPLPAIVPIPVVGSGGVLQMATVSDVPNNAGLKNLLLGTAVFQNEPAGSTSYSSPSGC